MSKQAYDFGCAVGMLKSGSVARVEKENAKLFKIAKLLQRKGKLTKSALINPEQASPGSAVASMFAPKKKKTEGPNMADVKAKVLEEAGRLEESEEGWTPQSDSAERLRKYTEGTPMTLPGRGAPAEKGKGGEPPKPIELEDTDRIRQHRAAGKGGGRAAAGAGGPSDAGAGFYGGPQFGDVQKYWQQLLGMTPSQFDARSTAQEAGLGRAWKHRGNLNWLRAILGQ